MDFLNELISGFGEVHCVEYSDKEINVELLLHGITQFSYLLIDVTMELLRGVVSVWAARKVKIVILLVL